MPAPHVPLAEVTRGPVVESVHTGAAVACDAGGRVVAAAGDPDLLTFPRSSLKPFQALPLVESGAADAFGLTPAHLALACASHRAEPFQVELVTGWLAGLGLGEGALACGPAWPAGPADRDARVARGEGASRRFHNCSGKHAGMLTGCRHLGLPTDGYNRPDHPWQRAVLAALGEVAGRDVAGGPLATDGCDLPAPALPLRDTAAAVARFAAARGGAAPGRSEAMARLLDAMRRHPEHVSGRGRPTERVAAATGGRVLVKVGAEGFLVAWLPAEALGVAIKTADGADRARYPALLELLARLRLLSSAEAARLEDLRRPTLVNSAGREVGRVRPCLRLRAPGGPPAAPPG